MLLPENTIAALKTMGGAMQYLLDRYHDNLEDDFHRERVCGYLKISPDDIYCVELTGSGFAYTTAKIQFIYFHHAFHGERKVMVRPNWNYR
ncbi:MAG: hypothetical protein ABI477_24565 [Chryseolinea sp.]